MLFNSLRFMLFFPCVALVYFLLPKKIRWGWLLVTSYVFYMGWNAKYAILLAFSTMVTYLCGRLLVRVRRRKAILLLCIGINIAILFFFKYYGFVFDNISALLGVLGLSFRAPAINVLLPVGISFYTFQAVGYMVDVYRGEIQPEKNVFRYALFISFFPQLMAGPIERSKNIIPQLYEAKSFDFERVRSGLTLMLWGFVQKLMIADRLAVYVDAVFDDYANCGSGQLVLAIIFFAMQNYCDFSSYSNIAIGCGRVFGIELMQNFNTPYLSRSIREYWHRWHISLSSWLRDYVFEPLAWSRWNARLPVIGHFFKKPPMYSALLITFLVSGIWHGARWNYVFWGLLHGLYQVCGMASLGRRRRVMKKLKLSPKAWYIQLWQVLFTFTLVCISYVFFRANSLTQAVAFFSRVLAAPWLAVPEAGFFMGLSIREFVLCVACVLFVITSDLVIAKTRLPVKIFTGARPLRWLVYLGAIAGILIFGIYGEGVVEKPFIYFQF